MAPMPSNMQWFMARPSAKPPHLNLVTCTSVNPLLQCGNLPPQLVTGKFEQNLEHISDDLE